MNGDRRQFLSLSALAGLSQFQASDETKLDPKEDSDDKFTWFCARVPYNAANGRHVKRLPFASPLEFFQTVMPKGTSSEDALGIDSYGTANIFGSGGFVPKTELQLKELIQRNCYVTTINVENGLVEYLSDDDELDMSYYFFDSDFAKQNPDRVAFLLHQGWLPQNVDEHEETEPTTHVLARMPASSGDSNKWDYFKLDGHRLDRIGDILEVMKADKDTDMKTLKDFLHEESKSQSWAFLIAKFVAKKAHTYQETTFQCSPHVCELNYHAEEWGRQRVYEQLIVVDDLWAKTHPDLFASMMRFQEEELLFADSTKSSN